MLSRSHKLDAVIVNAISDYAQATTQESNMPSNNPNPNPLEIEPTYMDFVQPVGLQVMVENSTQIESDSEGLAVNDNSRRCDSATDNSNQENHNNDSSHDRIEVLQQLIEVKVRAVHTHILKVILLHSLSTVP